MAVRAPSELRRKLPEGRTPAEDSAGLMVEGIAPNTLVARMFSSNLPETDITEAFSQTLSQAGQVSNGDRSGVERILAAQVLTLNAIFTDLARRAQVNRLQGEIFERLMRLGLKAQSQCRATAETIAVMQAPPTVFAKQANIASGAQQVNNAPTMTVSRVRAGDPRVQPNKLLQAGTYVEGIERVDTGASGTAAPRDPALEAVDAVNRTEKRPGKSPSGTKRVQGRAAAARPRGTAPTQRIARAAR